MQEVGNRTNSSLMQNSKMRSVTMCVYSLLLLALPCTLGMSSRSSQLHRVGGRRGVVTRVTYQEPVEERVVVHKVHHVRGRKKKRIRRVRPVRPVAVVPAQAVHPVAGFEGG